MIIEYDQTKSKSRIKLQSSWILSKHLIEDNYEPLTQFICQPFDFNTLKSSAKFPMSASYNALFWRLLKFCPCFLDAQASLAPTPVRTSVRKFVGHTFRFPFCQCLWTLIICESQSNETILWWQRWWLTWWLTCRRTWWPTWRKTRWPTWWPTPQKNQHWHRN